MMTQGKTGLYYNQNVIIENFELLVECFQEIDLVNIGLIFEHACFPRFYLNFDLFFHGVEVVKKLDQTHQFLFELLKMYLKWYLAKTDDYFSFENKIMGMFYLIVSVPKLSAHFRASCQAATNF